MGGPRSRRGPMTRRHPMSASPRRLALHFHLPSYRCVAVRIRCASVGTKRLYSISFRSHHSESSQFRCQSQRVLSVSCHCRHRLAFPSRSHALHFLPISLRIATSLIRSLAGLIVTASLLLPALRLDGADGHLSGVGESGRCGHQHGCRDSQGKWDGNYTRQDMLTHWIPPHETLSTPVRLYHPMTWQCSVSRPFLQL